MSESLKHKAARGSVWATVDRMAVMAMTFVVNMVMARLLTQADFGLVGMVYVFTNISTVLIDGGFGSALIQKKDPTQKDYSTVFFWNIGFAALLYGLLFVCAAPIARFYHQPQLVGVVRLLGLIVIANSVFVTQFAKLRLEFRFGTLAAINIGSALLGGLLGIFLAARGLGVYSLVWSQVCVAALQCTGCFALGRWLPSLTFSWATMKRLFGFGGYLLAANVLQVVCNNVQYLIIGRRFAPAQLGLYSQAQKTDQIVSYHIPQILVQVMFPLYSKLQDDKQQLLQTLEQNMRLVGYVVFPIIALLMLLAEPVFELLYGAKWVPAAPYFRVFCVGGLFVALQNINFYAVAAKGHSRSLFRWSFYKWGALLAFMLAGMNFGMYGMLWALVASNANIFLVNALLASKFTGFRLRTQLRALLPPALLTALAAGTSLLVHCYNGGSQWWMILPFAVVYLLPLAPKITKSLKIIILGLIATLSSCSTTKHVPEGEYLLKSTRIEVADPGLTAAEFENYLRQKPNQKVLWALPLRLHTYSLSGRDSTRWINRRLRNMGEPPVIYSQRLAEASVRQLSQALVNRGYLHPKVEFDTLHTGKKKLEVVYRLQPGQPHYLGKINVGTDDPQLAPHVSKLMKQSLLTPGNLLDLTLLDSERTRLVTDLQNQGYYGFSKDRVAFTADTVAGSRRVDLTMRILGENHRRFTVRRVIFQPNYSPNLATTLDTVPYGSIYIINNPAEPKSYISPKVLEFNNWITPGAPYSAREFDRTYQALSRLGILRSITIDLQGAGDNELDAIIRLSRNPLQGVSVELEGTNSEGDLGAGVGVTYQHRNIFRGSETLSLKTRGAYESLSGNLEGLINNHYTEGAAELALSFPKMLVPLLSKNYKRSMLATTELAVNGNYQERPEYTRVIAGAGWKYRWNNPGNTNRRIFDLVDISYVFLPRSTINFLDDVAGGNPLLRYSYEDHFIMRMGYSAFLTNKRTLTPLPGVKTPKAQRLIWTFRGSTEIAGNLLYALSHIIGQRRSDGAYKIFSTQYAQYAKGEADFMVSRRLSPRASLAFHAGGGVAVPYGNSSMVPFEKRFYAGGANGVRGWSVRTLGPGRYDSRNTVSNFINQCGDIRLDFNLEARLKLFWVLEGAAFIDAGNVWTIRNYRNQPGGLFRFDSFYKELAWAYGLGLRLDFTYFLLRLDLGMKAYNPAMNQQPWPLVHPKWRRDATFHFSVGYPF